MRMQSFGPLMDTRSVKPNAGGGAQGLPLILGSIVAIAVVMSGCSRAQSSGQSKPRVLAQATVMRTVTVKFDYDFSRFPPCSAKRTAKCIERFNVYDVSANPQVFLFSVAVPQNAKRKWTGITGSAPQKQPFPTGMRRIGVSAVAPPPNGESDPNQCVTFAQVLPDNPAVPAGGSTAPKK